VVVKRSLEKQGYVYTQPEQKQHISEKTDTIRNVLTSDGRTLAQAALSWIWTYSERTVPIPAFKTVEQAEENVRAMEFGPLSDEQMAAVANARNALQI
jgi:aryl-alcohol dehydrogenase-like predicted oxidoreductase